MNATRACRIIDGLCMDLGTEDAPAPPGFASRVYRLAHIGGGATCDHADWEAEALALEASMVARQVIPKWEEPA